MNEIRIGIVGSRRRVSSADCRYVFELVKFLSNEFGNNLVIVSGGCRQGADHFAELAANEYGVKIVIHKPILKPIPKCKFDMIARYYARNKRIAQDSNYLYALVSDDRTGGTENTIKHMNELKKPTTEVHSDFTEVGTMFNDNSVDYEFLPIIFRKPNFKR